MWLKLLISFAVLSHNAVDCMDKNINFPADLIENWTVSGNEVLTFTETTLWGYNISTKEEDWSNDSWELISNSSLTYILKAVLYKSNATSKVTLYTCLYLVRLSVGVWVMYQSPKDEDKTFKDHVYLNDFDENKIYEICNLDERPLTSTRSSILLKMDLQFVAKMPPFECPAIINGVFHSRENSACVTILDACSDFGKIIVTKPECLPGLFYLSPTKEEVKDRKVNLTCLFSHVEGLITSLFVLYVDKSEFTIIKLKMTDIAAVLTVTQFIQSKLTVSVKGQVTNNEFKFDFKKPLCTFPKSFNGRWVGNRHFELTVDNRAIRASKSFCSTGQCLYLSFECVMAKENRYIMRSIERFRMSPTPLTMHIYACFIFIEMTPSKNVYYFASKGNTTTDIPSMLLISKPSLDVLNTVCVSDPYSRPTNLSIVVKKEAASDAATLFPRTFKNRYQLTFGSCVFYLSICSEGTHARTTVNGCKGVLPFFSEEGHIYNVYNDLNSERNIIVFFNDDKAVDYKRTYPFVCVLWEANATHITLLAFPLLCQSWETAQSFEHQHIVGLARETKEDVQEVGGQIPKFFNNITYIAIGCSVVVVFVPCSYVMCKKSKEKRKKQKAYETSKIENVVEDSSLSCEELEEGGEAEEGGGEAEEGEEDEGGGEEERSKEEKRAEKRRKNPTLASVVNALTNDNDSDSDDN